MKNSNATNNVPYFDTMMEVVYDTDKLERISFSSFLEQGFSWDDIKAFCLDERHKTNGHYNYPNNLYLCGYLKPMILQEKDITKLEQYILEYVEVNWADFIVKHLWFSRWKKTANGEEYRKGLSQQQIEHVMTTIADKTSWQQEIPKIQSYFDVIDLVSNRLSYTYEIYSDDNWDNDSDFVWLITYLFSKDFKSYRQSSKVLTNLCEFFLSFDPYSCIKSYILPQYNVLFDTDDQEQAKASMDDFVLIMDEFNQFSSMFIFALLIEIDKALDLRYYRYHQKKSVYESLVISNLLYLNNKFTIEDMLSIYDSLLTDKRIISEKNAKKYERPNVIYHLFHLADPDNQLIKNRYQFEVERNIETFTTRWCKTEEDAKSLFAFVLTGENLEKIKDMKATDNIPKFWHLPLVYIQRLAHVVFNGKNNKCTQDFVREVIHSFSFKTLIEIVIEYPHLQKAFLVGFNGNVCRERLIALFDHQIECLPHIVKTSNTYKSHYLPYLSGLIQDEKQALLLFELLKKPIKIVLADTLNCIDNLDEALKAKLAPKLYERLGEFEGEDEKNAIHALSLLPLEKEKIIKLLPNISSAHSRALLLEKNNIDFKSLYQTKDGRFDLKKYLSIYYQAPEVFPVDEKLLKLVKMNDGKPAGDLIKQLVLIYYDYENFIPSPEALAIISELDDDSLLEFYANISAFDKKVLSERENRWLVRLPALHANANIIKTLVPIIEHFAKGSLYPFAAQIMKLIGGSGITEAYIALDRLGRTQKKKTVKEAAEEAFELGAKRRGIDKNELGDLLLEDLGFVNGEIPLRYCEQDFALLVGNDLKFVIKKTDGKIAKSLPKPKADDNAEAAAEIAKYFTNHKKLLKEMVSLQTYRLEDALIIWRQWTVDKWQNVFINNPVMNKLAGKLVWGVYQDNKLVQSFIVNPTPVDCEDEAVEFASNVTIGLVHPLEMDKSTLEQWGEYFTDWKISPLFDQLERKEITLIAAKNARSKSSEYQVEEENRKSPNTVLTRLRKKGWYIGTIIDSGSLRTIYREVGEIGIEIEFDEYLDIGDYGYRSDSDSIAIEFLRFYQTGVMPRESYSFAQLTDSKYSHLLLPADKLPERLVQELAREAITAFL